MPDDTTYTLDQKLRQHKTAFEFSLHRAHQDAHRQDERVSSQHLRWMHEDHAKEVERMLQDDFIANLDAWQCIGVWLESEFDRAAIDAMRVGDYHYVEWPVTDSGSGEHGIALYRKAVSND